MTKEYPSPRSATFSDLNGNLNGDLDSRDARCFRMHLLNIYAIGFAVWDVIWEVARNESWDPTGIAAINTAVSAIDNLERHLARGVVCNLNLSDARDVAIDVEQKGGKVEQIAFACSRCIILDRKKIFSSIDALGDKISSASMTIDDAAKRCAKMMTFDDRRFAQLKLTVPLKMIDYLLGYERAILFLRGDGADLMEKHTQLVRRLGLEKIYTNLTLSQYTVTILSEHLPSLPSVLVEIIVGYGHLCKNNFEDLDEIYDRLLKIDWTKDYQQVFSTASSSGR